MFELRRRPLAMLPLVVVAELAVAAYPMPAWGADEVHVHGGAVPLRPRTAVIAPPPADAQDQSEPDAAPDREDGADDQGADDGPSADRAEPEPPQQDTEGAQGSANERAERDEPEQAQEQQQEPAPPAEQGSAADPRPPANDEDATPADPPQRRPRGPNIVVQPQIQVQVNPDIEVKAEPEATADADANADAEAKADANAEADVDARGVRAPGITPAEAEAPPRPDEPSASDGASDSDAEFVPYTHTRKTPLIAGLVTFTLSYGWTAFAGWHFYDNCKGTTEADECRDTARNLFIPVAGPFMNIPEAVDEEQILAYSVAGGAQSIGALLTVVGSVILARDRRRNRILNEQGGIPVGKTANLQTTTLPGGGGLQLSGRF